jgi:hypothetical protein
MALTRRLGAYYREALALADELGMRPLVAHCHLGLGKLHRRIGPRQQAVEHLITATAMYHPVLAGQGGGGKSTGVSVSGEG